MKLYRIKKGQLLEQAGQFYKLPGDWEEIINQDDILLSLKNRIPSLQTLPPTEASALLESQLLPPVNKQEVWAAGVTYFRSRSARMEESEAAGGADFYDKVYEADRPEIFFKGNGWRAIGPQGNVRIRKDSSWNVPEPELTLVINNKGQIIGYTIGNDMSSRSIEGENPLYLPQAKSYDGSLALGPCIWLGEQLGRQTTIRMEIVREERIIVDEHTDLSQLKRDPEELVEYLYREMTFPNGCLLMTGTGIVPENFTLQAKDEIRIIIPPIGTLVNRVAES